MRNLFCSNPKPFSSTLSLHLSCNLLFLLSPFHSSKLYFPLKLPFPLKFSFLLSPTFLLFFSFILYFPSPPFFLSPSFLFFIFLSAHFSFHVYLLSSSHPFFLNLFSPKTFLTMTSYTYKLMPSSLSIPFLVVHFFVFQDPFNYLYLSLFFLNCKF